MERHVLPLNQSTPFDPSGFLVLPSGEQPSWRDPVAPTPVAALLGGGSFVLLAPGGVGKTTVLDWLREREPGARSVDLLALELGGMRNALEEAAGDAPAVYVDAVDEVARLEPRAAHVLKRVLTGQVGQGTAWRLGCRPASWPSSLANALAGPSFRELRLLPLTLAAAREVVKNLVPDSGQFIDAVTAAGLGRLSASPMQLRAAARQWRETGQLPASHVEAIEFEVRHLLAETNPDRQPTLPADRLYRLAGRLAAISVFSGVALYSRTATSAPRAVPVADLPSTSEPDQPDAVNPDAYGAVLGTALFDAAPHANVMFRHQQYAEYLAAEYLRCRRATTSQVTQLLCVTDGIIPGAMAGVAAWLAAVEPSLVEDHLATNPVAFLAAGVELAEQARAAVVNGLMSKAAAGDIEPEWGLDLTGLAHPGLEDQLREPLAAGLGEPVEVWWLARLAHAGRCHDLAGELVRLAVDPRWPEWARRAAIAAVKDLGGDDHRRQLHALLRLDADIDPDDELLAGAIDALYPELMTTSELLTVLRPQRNTHLLGAYRVLLGQLADRVPTTDLPAALTWMAEQVREDQTNRAYRPLAKQLVIRGWNHAHTPAVRDALADLLAALRPPVSQTLHLYSEELPWVEQPDQQRRRHLAVAMAAQLGEQWYQFVGLGLLTDADLDWLLDELPQLPAEAQQVLATCLTTMFPAPTAAQANRVLALDPSHPAYEATRSWRDAVAVDSEPVARRRQAWRAKEEASTAVAQAPRERHEAITDALRRTADDITRWWQVAYLLPGHPGDTQKVFSHDLTTRPGWSQLTTDEQQRVLDQGLRYVKEHVPQPSACLGRKGIEVSDDDTALQDWSGVYLLTTLARHNAARLADLAADVWEAWAPAVVGAWNYDADDDARLRCTLVDHAPAKARARIVDLALDQLDLLAAHDKLPSPLPLYKHLCRELAPRLTPRLAEWRYGDTLGTELLGILAQQAPQEARDVCHALRGRPAQQAIACQVLADLDPEGTVDDLTCRQPTGEEVTAAASHIRLEKLDSDRLAALAGLLLDRFGFATDPPPESLGFHGSTYHVRDTRNGALRLLSQRGAVDTLQSLADGRTDLDRRVIGHYIRVAQRRAADLRLSQVEPEELMRLLSRGDARLVRHSDDLLSVVVEQLEQIQRLVRTGGYRYLWNMIEGGEPRPKSEDDITDWVCIELRHRIGGGSMLHREVQVQRPPAGGIGTRIDLTVTTSTATVPVETVRLTIEAKHVNNPSLPTAMTSQLVQKYLEPAGLRHGIYLVYWIDPAQRPSGWTNRDLADQAELLKELERQAESHREERTIAPYILDISQTRRVGAASSTSDSARFGATASSSVCGAPLSR